MNRAVGNFSSRLFQPVSLVPKNAEIKQKLLPKSQKLLLDTGLIRQSSPGIYHYLPLGLRVLNKLNKIVDRHMEDIGAQKMQIPSITEGRLWKKTGRWTSEQLESFKFQDRHKKDYLLSPTHEESVTDLIASLPPISYKQLPLLLYQISSKYRDEVKPRCGLIRSREFIMKDLYSFDIDQAAAELTYNKVVDAYKKLFDQLNVPYYFALGESGEMGGSLSHEFHFPTDIGEDIIKSCTKCSHSVNIQLDQSPTKCAHCGNEQFVDQKSIEVGHTFLLGTKYSRALNACCVNQKGDKTHLVMGSYGLGLSRIMAASVEVLSLQDQIRWPCGLTPFSCVIIPPKEGSKEAESCGDLHLNIYEHLNELSYFENDILVDDRPGLTIGRKLYDSQRMGYPFSVIIGSMASQTPSLIELRIIDKDEPIYLSVSELIHHFDQAQSKIQDAINN